jgi:hypothetical protein
MASIDFTDFHLLRLKSERLRTLAMLLVLAVVCFIGLYHLYFAPESKIGIGKLILSTAFVFGIFEITYLLIVNNAIRKKRRIRQYLRYFEAIVEGALPVIAMAMIIEVSDSPYRVLISPAYPFIIIIIAASALHLTPKLTLITGLLSSTLYALLTIKVVYFLDLKHLSTEPFYLYLFMALMLFVVSAVIYFITHQLRSYVDAAVKEMSLQNELALASEVQNNLLPSPLPDLNGYDVDGFSTPAKHAGGDYYDLVKPEPDQTIFMLADVAGHGIGPALLTVSSRAYFRAILGEHTKVSEIIQRVNQLMANDLNAGQFVTLTALVLCMKSNQAKYFSAGHGPTLLIKKNAMVEKLEAQSIPLGIDVPLKIEPPIKFTIEPGDMVAMFSDGCYEGKNSAGEAFGLDRVIKLLRENQEKPVKEIIALLQQAVKEFTGRNEQQDDMTMLILKRMSDNKE